MGRTMLVAVVGLVVVSCSTSAISSTASSTTVTTRATTTTKAPSTTSTLPVEVFEARMDDLLEGSALLEPSAVLYEAPWGSGAGQLGLEHSPESGETFGPACLVSTADTWVILDSANHRMIISQDGVISSERLEVRYPIGAAMMGDTVAIVGAQSAATANELVFYSLTDRKETGRRSLGQWVMAGGEVLQDGVDFWFSFVRDEPESLKAESFWGTGADDREIDWRPLSNGWFVDADFRNYYTLIRLLDAEATEMGRWKLVGQAYFLGAEPDEQGSLTALFAYESDPSPMAKLGTGLAVVRLDEEGIGLLGLVPWVDEPKIWDAYELVDSHTLRMLLPDSDGVRLLEFRF